MVNNILLNRLKNYVLISSPVLSSTRKGIFGIIFLSDLSHVHFVV